MDWEFFWAITSCIADVFAIVSVVISVALWLSFGKLKRVIERQRIKYVEDHDKIVEELQLSYNSIFIDNVKDDDVISRLRQQIYSIDRNFERLLKSEDLKCVKKLMKILGKDTGNINFAELRINLDFIIITFRERIYDYD